MEGPLPASNCGGGPWHAMGALGLASAQGV